MLQLSPDLTVDRGGVQFRRYRWSEWEEEEEEEGGEGGDERLERGMTLQCMPQPDSGKGSRGRWAGGVGTWVSGG